MLAQIRCKIYRTAFTVSPDEWEQAGKDPIKALEQYEDELATSRPVVGTLLTEDEAESRLTILPNVADQWDTGTTCVVYSIRYGAVAPRGNGGEAMSQVFIPLDTAYQTDTRYLDHRDGDRKGRAI